jgi:hypothetical protein
MGAEYGRVCARCLHPLVGRDDRGWYYQAPASDPRVPGLTFMDRVHECDGRPHDTDEYTRLLRVAAGIDSRQWDQLDYPGREYVLAQGRIALVRAAKVSRKTWNALPARSRARSDILLKGAAALRIDTDWQGWADTDSS